MSKVYDFLKEKGFFDRVIEFDSEIPTVQTAAANIGCTDGEIAKTLSFKIDEQCILIVMAGDVKIDNAKYRGEFGTKARMLDFEEVPEKTGHPVGGVCPFIPKEGVKVYFDESLKRFDIVYPACGARNNCIKLSIDELFELVKPVKWIDVTKEKELI